MIYGDEKEYMNEITPQNISNDSELNEHKPQQLILNIGSYSKPSLIDILYDIRTHVINCIEGDVLVDIIFNICIDHPPYESDVKYLNKFIFLIDYLSELENQLDATKFNFNIRGYVTPMIFPIVASKFEYTIHPYSVAECMFNDIITTTTHFVESCNRIARSSGKIEAGDDHGPEYCRKEIIKILKNK